MGRASLARLLLAAAFTALAAWNLSVARPSGELRDYGSFVASGRAAAQGQDPYGIHPLTFHVVLPAFEIWNPNLNPPISITIFRLFDGVEPQRGFVIWWAVSLAAYLLAVALLARRYGSGPSHLLVFWALALAGFWDTLALGQIYVPLVLAAVGSWLLIDRERHVAAGVLMGIVVAVKPNFAVWPLMLALSGHWRAPVSACSTAAILWLVPLATEGWQVYPRWFELVLSDKGRAAFLTNTSLPGLAARVGAAGAAPVLSAGILATLALTAIRRRLEPLHASALGILGGILASPVAWVHYTLFLLPIFFSRRMSAPLAAAAVLLVVPVHVVLRLTDAPIAVQSTLGSVYTWGVVACLVAVFRSSPRASSESLALELAPGVIPASPDPSRT